MLPPPAFSLTIPSIQDNLVLQCRVYHPACLAPTKVSQIQEWRKRAAIVAHPYAPLGGCYDDPVVDIVASIILKQGFIVGTFNFRGAGTSTGRTSWQSKAEQNDYISFVGFMTYYLHNLSPPSSSIDLESRLTPSDPELHGLSPIPSQAVPPPHATNREFCTTNKSCNIPQIELDIPRTPPECLLLAGYSYGAMITSFLPPSMSSMIQPFQQPLLGSAYAEIRMRADCLASQQNELMKEQVTSLLSRIQARGRTLQIEDKLLCNPKSRKQSGGMRLGGEEDLRRASHESYRSRGSFTIETPEKVRKSVDRVKSIARSSRMSLGSASSHGSFVASSKRECEPKSPIEHVTSHGVDTTEEENLVRPIQGVTDAFQIAYLLVSPLHGWVNTLATMWSSKAGREKEIQPGTKFTVDPTLVLFGDDDVFVNVKRLRSWVEKLKRAEMECGSCRLRHREVPGAGHFWHDHVAIQVLQEEVKSFVASL